MFYVLSRRQPVLFLIGIATCLLLSGCVSLNSAKNWPSEMPDRSIFINSYKEKTNKNPSKSELNQHLVWIKRFYLGSILYPTGWNEMIDLVEASIESDADKKIARKKLVALGITISIEWAQNNSIRKITSSNIAIWGRSLRTAAETNDQLNFISVVEKDVENLLLNRLDDEQITRERYYPPEDYDNF